MSLEAGMRFRSPRTPLLLLIGLVGATCLHLSASQDSERAASPKAKLELTYLIVESKYCFGGGMLLILQSKYKNVGEEKLIVFKYALAPFQHRVSRSLEAARVKRYEQVISPMMGSGRSLLQLGDEPPSDYFVFLEPGQTYTPVNTITIPMFITDKDEKTSKDYLGPGEHVLQLYVSMWPFDDKPDAEFGIRWQRFGTLWAKPILSLPMPFQIEPRRKRSLANCNEPIKKSELP